MGDGAGGKCAVVCGLVGLVEERAVAKGGFESITVQSGALNREIMAMS